MTTKTQLPPRLVYLVTEDHYFCSHRWDLAKDAMNRGYEVHVVTNVTEHGERIRHAGFRLHRLYSLHRTQMNPFRDIMAVWEIVKVLRKIRPHILHNVAWKPTLYGSLAGLIVRVPKIISMLGGLGFTFTSDAPKAVSARKVITFMGKWILSKTRCQIIVQNEENRDVLLEHKLCRLEQIHIIRGSGVDVDYYHPLPRVDRDPTATVQFVCAARLIREKGIAELAAAMQQIRQNPDILRGKTIRMILYGEIDEKYPNKITQDELQLWQGRGWVEWRGFEPNMRSVLQSADVVVLPSYAEGMPKILLEAAACGKPIITTNVSGCRDVVRHRYNGLLVPAADVQSLVEAIVEMAQSDDIRFEMGSLGRTLILQNFARDIIHEQIFHLYDEHTEKHTPEDRRERTPEDL